jgi:4-amino-4-deoxy-L-arabinose transferase-like glycosyltransferase
MISTEKPADKSSSFGSIAGVSGATTTGGFDNATSRAPDNKVCLWIVVACCLALFFFRLGNAGLIDPGDGYFSEAAREMIEYGDYITPHLNYQIYFSKPILIFWLIISAYKMFGISAFAARFWSAVLATATVGICYLTLARLQNRRAGLIAAVVLASSPLMVTFARMSMTDMPFSSFLGIAMCAAALTLIGQRGKWWMLLYASLGLAVLSKGPAALVTFAMGMVGYFLIACRSRRQWWQAIKNLHVLPGAAICGAIALPWYIAVGLATGWLWPQVFLVFENLGRFAGQTNHLQPSPFFYLPVLAYGFFPWILFLPAAMGDSFKSAKSVWKTSGEEVSGSIGSTGALEPSGRDSLKAQVMFFCWAAAIIVFFSLSKTKLQTYILPAFPALAMVVGATLDRVLDTSSWTRTMKIAAGILGGIGAVLFLLSIAAAIMMAAPSILPHKLAAAASIIADLPTWMKIAAPIAVAIGGIGFVAFARYRGKALVFMSAAYVAACTILAPIAFEEGFSLRQADLDKVVASLKTTAGPIAIYREFKPSIFGIVERPIDAFFSVDQIHASLPSVAFSGNEKQYIITGDKGAAEILQAYPGKFAVFSQSGKWQALVTDRLRVQRLPTLEETFTKHLNLSTENYTWGTLPFAGGSKPPSRQLP